MAKKQIIICSPQLGLDPNSFLGGEVHDANVINELCKLGAKCLILLPKDRFYRKHPNLRVEYLTIKPVVPPHLFNLLCLPFLFRTYHSNPFSVLRLHNPYFLGIAGLIFKKVYPNVKLVTTIHLAEDRIDLDLILKLTVNIYDQIFTVSQYLKEWLVKKYKIDPNKVTVIYNGVDPSLKPAGKDPVLTKKYKLKNKIVLLNIGLMIARKNVLFLLDVFCKLHSKHPNLILMYVGQGPQKSEILQKSIKLGLSDKVIVEGPVVGSLKQKMFNLTDFFLFPSLSEGFGLVVAEAMSCGKTVITSKNTSLVEIVDNNKTGVLIRENDLERWVEKINFLLNNPRIAKKIGKSGRIYAAKHFKWSLVAERTIKVLEAL